MYIEDLFFGHFSHPRTSQTVTRKPRTHGFPPRLSGSMVIREFIADISLSRLIVHPSGRGWPEGPSRSPEADQKKV
jgi:hypothetical protein